MIAFNPKGGCLIPKNPFLRVEDFALPGEVIDKIRDVLRVSRAGRDDRRALRFTLGEFTGRHF